MTITPVGNKILVLPIPKKEEVIGSIAIPETANAELSEGEVVAVSDEMALLFDVGDVVLYPTRSGLGQFYNGVPHLWLKIEPQNSEVWGKVNYSENE